MYTRKTCVCVEREGVGETLALYMGRLLTTLIQSVRALLISWKGQIEGSLFMFLVRDEVHSLGIYLLLLMKLLENFQEILSLPKLRVQSFL